MALSTDPRLDKGHGCYFYAQFARDSFCGHLDPAFEAVEGFNEETIADFIRAAKPGLFRQLGRLPVSSTDVTGPAPRLDKSSSKPNPADNSARSDTQVVEFQHPTTARQEHRPSALRQPPLHVEQYMLDLQHKRYVQSRVLNGYDLTIRKLIVPSLVLPCSDPQCTKDASVIPKGAFFLTLSKSVLDPSGGVVKKSVLHYNLTCLEGLFDRGLSVRSPYEVDGRFDEPETTAACLNQFSSKKIDGHFDGPADPCASPSQFPSNSPEALYLRQKRYNEFATTPVTPSRTKISAAPVLTSAGKTPNLKLSRPNDVSPYDRRYKKQGLTYENRRKSRTSEQLQNEQWLEKPSSKPEARICYCREPANGSELVQCSSSTCMIGIFHLQCLNLQEPLEEGDKVYCSYCAEDLRPMSDSESAGDTTSNTGGVHADDESESVLTSRVPELLDGKDIQVERLEEAANSDTNMNNDAVTSSHTGFVAINDPKTCLNIWRGAQADGARSPIPATPYLKPISTPASKTKSGRQKKHARVSLQPGSSQISFADLAPFISVSHLAYSPLGLTNNEARAFLQWKSSCPKSRLLEALPIEERINKGLKPNDAWYPVDPRDYVPLQNRFAPRKLSELLTTVGG